MPPEVRRAFLLVAAAVAVLAVGWASYFESTPPAEFSMQNSSDPKTLDPHRATGNIESRLIFALFNGLLQMLPEGDPDPETGLQPMTAQPAMAESYEVSDDGKTYTFHLRDGIFWTDGAPVTSHDFAWSWQRMLHPATACEYTFQLYGVPFAEQYSSGEVAVGTKLKSSSGIDPGTQLRRRASSIIRVARCCTGRSAKSPSHPNPNLGIPPTMRRSKTLKPGGGSDGCTRSMWLGKTPTVRWTGTGKPKNARLLSTWIRPWPMPIPSVLMP